MSFLEIFVKYVRKSTSAVGLRHMLPMQTKMIFDIMLLSISIVKIYYNKYTIYHNEYYLYHRKMYYFKFKINEEKNDVINK